MSFWPRLNSKCWVCMQPRFCTVVCRNCLQKVCYHCCIKANLCKPCYIPAGLPPPLPEYMRLANSMNIYVNQTLLKSSTRLCAGLEPYPRHVNGNEQPSFVDHSFHITRGGLEPKIENYKTLEDFMNALVNYSMKYSVGNCTEFALLALYFFKENYEDYLLPSEGVIQVCEIQGGDHSFLVIGEIEHPNSIIVDPWSKTKYLMREKLTKLKNYNDGKLEPFNPAIHRIVPTTFYIDKKKKAMGFEWSDTGKKRHRDFELVFPDKKPR